MDNKIFISERGYKILTYLESQEVVKHEELATELNCCGKTILNEIHKMNEDFPEGWQIEVMKGIGMRLIMPMDQTVATTFKNEAELLYLKFFQILIEHDGITLENLCELVHYNKNTVISIIKKLEKMLETFRLKLMRSPYRIEGNEAKKRLFMFELIFKFRGPEYFQVETEHSNKHLLEQYLREHCHIDISVYGMNAYMEFINISVKRIQEGYPIENVDQYFKRNLLDVDEFTRIEKFICYIGELYDVDLSMDEKKVLYLALIFTDLKFKYSNSNREDQKIYDETVELIEKIETCLDIKGYIHWSDDLVLSMFTLYKIMLLKSDFIGIDYMPSKSILNIMKDKYSVLYNNIEKIIYDFVASKEIQVSKSFIIRIVTLIAENIANSPAISVKALFITSRIIVFNDYLLHSIQSQFPVNLDVKIGTLECIEQDLTSVDCIITDLVIHKDITPTVILVHSVPTRSDYLKVKQAIEHMIKERLHAIYNRDIRCFETIE